MLHLSPPPASADGPRVDLVTERSARAVPHARAHVTGVLRTWQIPMTVVEDAALLVTELAANAVRHGTGPTLRIHTRCQHRTLRCQIHDNGPDLNLGQQGPVATPERPSHEPTPDRSPRDAGLDHPDDADGADSLPENGRGLALVDALATRWGSYTDPGLVNGQHIVWFEITWPESDPESLHRVLTDLGRNCAPPPTT